MKAILLNGEDMLARCREGDTEQLREDLGRLRTRMYDTRSKADRRKVRPTQSPYISITYILIYVFLKCITIY